VEILGQHLLMVEPPRGMYPRRLDDKGRVKLPAAFQQYFAVLQGEEAFCHSLDRRTAQVYPMEVWRQREVFRNVPRRRPLARNVAFNAADLGAEAKWMARAASSSPPSCGANWASRTNRCGCIAYRGRIEVLTEAIYEERKREAAQCASDDLASWRPRG
jgi:hypothetical protein